MLAIVCACLAAQAAGIPCDDKTILEMIKLMDMNSDGEIRYVPNLDRAWILLYIFFSAHHATHILGFAFMQIHMLGSGCQFWHLT